MYSGAWSRSRTPSLKFTSELDDSKKRKPIPIEYIRQIQQDCKEADDEARWLVALISDTGMRLSEAAGLHIEDIKLEDEVHIDLKPYAWRSLKTRQSEADTTCWSISGAAQRIKEAKTESPYAFPRYTSVKELMQTQPQQPSISGLSQEYQRDGLHSFRHHQRPS